MRRRFILVEVAQSFEEVMLPRIKKATFAPDWKEGRPARMPSHTEADCGPQIMESVRIENYEDTLNNIRLPDNSGQQELGFDDYLLHYMLDWESRDCETFLDVEKLNEPFSYTLMLKDGDETVVKPVDLPETFNYLLGLHVETRRVYHDDDRRYLVYSGSVDDRKVAVIWRTTEDWNEGDYERDRKFVDETGMADGVDEIFVNADSCIEGARSLDPVFKRRMFGEEPQ